MASSVCARMYVSMTTKFCFAGSAFLAKIISHSTPSEARKNVAPKNATSLPHQNAVSSGRMRLTLSTQSMSIYASASGRSALGMFLRLPVYTNAAPAA